MAITVEQLQKKAIASGATTSKSFSGGMRSASFDSLQDGMIFTIPVDQNVIKAPIPRSIMKDADGKPILDENGRTQPNTVEYVFCQTVDGKLIPFYPSFLWKSLLEMDPQTGAEKGFVNAKGSVIDFAQNFATVDDAMNALAILTSPVGSVPAGGIPEGVSSVLCKGTPINAGRGYQIKATVNKVFTKPFGKNTIKAKNLADLNFVVPNEAPVAGTGF